MDGRPDFRTVYGRELGYVCNTLRRLGVPASDVRDLAHDVFLTALRRYSSYDPSRPLRPWLFGVAFRLVSASRQRAHHKNEQVEEVPQDAPDERPTGEEAAMTQQTRRQVLEALERLDLDRRAVLVLHDIDGEKMPDIAQAIGIPLNTAYSRLRVARERFAEAYRSLAGGGAAP